jgi:xanthine dehydrogenase YagS FAD-binding subunit
MAIDKIAYASASSVQEVLEVLDASCRPLAGGTDLVGLLKDELAAPSRLVDLKRIPGLDEIRETERGLHLGALTPLYRLQDHPAINRDPAWAVLAQAVRVTASPQIRHMATLGGNLLQRPRCWYWRNKLTPCLRKGGQRCFAFRGENQYHAILGGGPCYIVHPSDLAVALLALDASVILAGKNGERTLPLAEFYVLPRQDAHNETVLAVDELLIGIEVPTPAAPSVSAYAKVAEHGAHGFALLSVAAQLAFSGQEVRQARLALGGVAPVPWRAAEAEQALIGQPLTEQAIDQAARAATTGARPLAQNEFKIELAQGLVRQTLQSLLPQP